MKNLTELIGKGESDTLEFKKHFSKEVIVTTGAFANTKGGGAIQVRGKGRVSNMSSNNLAIIWQLVGNFGDLLIYYVEIRKLYGRW